MLGAVLRAFLAASGADRRTKRTELARERAAPRHERDREAANIRALPIHTNTICHGSHLLFFEAGCRTTFASEHAFLARLDTIGDLRLSHSSSFGFW